MSIGENIRRLRKQHEMTQKELGIALGFNENNADVRIAQYESSVRTPKKNLIINIASIFDVDFMVLYEPYTESYIQLSQEINRLEDLCGHILLEIQKVRKNLSEHCNKK